MKRKIDFIVSYSQKDVKGIKGSLHKASINIPEHLVGKCVDAYLRILLQSKYRSGRGEYGKLRLFGEEIEYTELGRKEIKNV